MESYFDTYKVNEQLNEQTQDKISSRSFQVMLAGNKAGLHPDLVEELNKRWGWDIKHPSPLSLPYSQYLEVAEFLRRRLYAEYSDDRAYEAIGYGAIRYYLNSWSGEIFRVLARMVGPQAGAKRFVQYMAQALPWGRHQLVEIRNGYACYRKTGVAGPPGLMLGIIRACLEATDRKITEVRYTVLSSGGHGAPQIVDYEVEWE